MDCQSLAGVHQSQGCVSVPGSDRGGAAQRKKRHWIDCQLAFIYGVDPSGWSEIKKWAWKKNIPAIRALKIVEAGKTDGLNVSVLRTIADLAFQDDPEAGKQWVSDVLQDRAEQQLARAMKK